jgi:hypothetical protein
MTKKGFPDNFIKTVQNLYQGTTIGMDEGGNISKRFVNHGV